MNRNIVGLLGWEVKTDELSDEIGIGTQSITLDFSSINEGETIQKTYDVVAVSEHFIASEKFIIRRESWAQKGNQESSYLNCYEILELLEKTIL